MCLFNVTVGFSFRWIKLLQSKIDCKHPLLTWFWHLTIRLSKINWRFSETTNGLRGSRVGMVFCSLLLYKHSNFLEKGQYNALKLESMFQIPKQCNFIYQEPRLHFDLLDIIIVDKCLQTSLGLIVICHDQMFQFTRKWGKFHWKEI